MSMIGTSVIRNEDPELLTTGGRYVDDVSPQGSLHATFVRSVMAHATLAEVDVTEAAEMPGVAAVWTAADLNLQPKPPSLPMFNKAMTRTHLAVDRVRYVGEPVAVILSETNEQGVDAAEAVFIDYEPLDVVIDARASADGGPVLFDELDSNIVWAQPSPNAPDLFDGCEVVVEQSLSNPRMNVAAIESRATASLWGLDADGREHLTQWASSQFPHGTRDGLVGEFGLETEQVRVITPDVGGGFGGKNGLYVEDLVVAHAARKVGRPVRWAETRSESMLNFAHGRAMHFDAKIGGTADGKITAYKLHAIQDSGAYPAIGAALPMFTSMMASGVYDMTNVEFSSQSVLTNSTPVGAFRGAGRPEATSALERMVDLFAAEVGMDPVEVRRKNFIAPEAFPYVTPTGSNMDSGDYSMAMDAVIRAADYAGLRAEQERRRADAQLKLLGLGWSVYVEITNPMSNGEFGSIEVRPDGSALVLTGSSAHGQGHHTTFAQLASEVTGIAFDKIEVRHGDTDEVKRGGGTGGSKSLQLGGSAVTRASETLVDQAKQVAAAMLEANPEDIVLDTTAGAFSVVGTPAISTSWADIASHQMNETGLSLLAEDDFKPEGATFPFGAHLAVVEVDRETGEVEALRHVACDDAGTIINPMLVDGQVHGGIASGLGLALMEEFHYDEDGNPLTANFMDYAIPSAAEFPSFDRLAMETPTDRNPLGAKGIGEAGTIGATPALHNAVVDALAHLGVRHIEMPTTPQKVWRKINGR